MTTPNKNASDQRRHFWLFAAVHRSTGAYKIIPAPTVLLLLSSMMMKAPVLRFAA